MNSYHLEYGAAMDGGAVSPVGIQHLAVMNPIGELVDKEELRWKTGANSVSTGMSTFLSS
jgi:hypothetical protein